MGFASFLGFGIMALAALAIALGRVGRDWAVVALVAVNLLIQPFCLYLFSAGVYKVLMAALGRVTYAWRTVPCGDDSPEQYRALLWYCVMQGFIVCPCAAGLAWICLRPLL